MVKQHTGEQVIRELASLWRFSSTYSRFEHGDEPPPNMEGQHETDCLSLDRGSKAFNGPGCL